MEIIIVILGTLAFIAALVLYESLVWGFVLYRLWYWFGLPVFPQLPHITFWQAVGLMFLIYLFHSYAPSPEYEGLKKKPNYTVLVAPWTLLSISWIFHIWII